MTTTAQSAEMRRLYWTSFALRFGVGLLALLMTQLYKIRMLEDALFYSYRAAEAAQYWLGGEQSPWLAKAIAEGRHAWLMIATLAVFYCLTGGVEMLPLALFCYSLLTSLTPILAYRAARQFGAPHRGSLAAARLIAYSPAFAFFSGALCKEGLILMAFFLLIEHLVRLQRGFSAGSLAALSVSLLALFGLRFYIGAILSVCLMAGLMLGRRNRDDESAVPLVLRQALIVGCFPDGLPDVGTATAVGRDDIGRTEQESPQYKYLPQGCGFLRFGIPAQRRRFHPQQCLPISACRPDLLSHCAVSLAAGFASPEYVHSRDVVLGRHHLSARRARHPQEFRSQSRRRNFPAPVRGAHLHPLRPVHGQHRHCVPSTSPGVGRLRLVRRLGWTRRSEDQGDKEAL